MNKNAIRLQIISPSLSNIPWEDRPAGSDDILWRYSKNPVIPRNLLPTSNSIFNSAVVPWKDQFAGVFRCDNKLRQMRIHAGFSPDGLNWKIEKDPIQFQTSEGSEILPFEYAYDPRVCFIDDRYYVSWCNGFHGAPTIGLAHTADFKTFYQMDNAFLPFNRNGVLFPRKINGKFAMVSRPSDTGHTPFGDIYYSESPDMTYWGKHRYVMGTINDGWQSTKIGAGPVPIETSEGWLLIYHGVLTSCNGFVYAMGAALLDLDEPWKVQYRTAPYILTPEAYYECVGDVPNVAFPCASLVDPDSDRLALYYGGADTVTCLAFTHVSQLVDFIKSNSI